MQPASFAADDRTYDAVVRNPEIIGEGANWLPLEAQQLASEIEWRKIVGLRNLIAHAYSGIDNDILWDVVGNEVPKLRAMLESITLTEL